MKLYQKIMCLVIGILVISIGSMTVLSFYQMKSLLKNQLGKDLIDISNSIANNYEIGEYLVGNKNVKEDLISKEIENIRIKTNVQFIVIMDMNGIRYIHPVKEKIGQKFEGGDEKRVLEKGEQYVFEAKGSLGESLRAFTPVYKGNKQVGAVCTGLLADQYYDDIYKKISNFVQFIFFGLILGFIGAVLLSYNIKKVIFGLEPEEIALVLKQKEAVLESIKDGIISVDKEGRLTLFNKEAKNILGLTDDDIGKNIKNFTYESIIDEVLKCGESIENVEIKTRPGLTLMCKYNVMKNNKNEVIGVVTSFRDLTEIKKMAEELTGIKKMAWSLRAQNHEFMNKLHTISGLIQLEEYDEALKFISDTAQVRKNVSNILTNNIKDVSLSALLFAKYNKAEECRVKLIINPESNIRKLPEYMTSEEIVSVVGNLIENSLDAVKNDGLGEIYIKIIEKEHVLHIEVKDNGSGISPEIADKIYEQGVTTKDGQRGYGMYIVKKIIDEAQGTIEFKVDKGTYWNIRIPMIRSELYDSSNDN